MAVMLNLKSIVAVGTGMLRSRSPPVALSALRSIARCFLVISSETHGLALRCHLRKVLEVPLVHTALIHCFGTKEAAIYIWILLKRALYPRFLSELSA